MSDINRLMRYRFQPLRPSDSSPIFLHCKNTEEEGKYNPFRSLKFGSIPTKFLLSFIPDQ